MTDRKEFRYLVKEGKGFSIGLCGKTVDAVDGILTLTPAENEDLKKLIHNGRPDIADMLHLLDLEAADTAIKDGINHPKKHVLTDEEKDKVERVKNAPVSTLAGDNTPAAHAVMDELTSSRAGLEAQKKNDLVPENRHEMDEPEFDPNAGQGE